MRILSIDVGIKHLAFCLFDCENNIKYKIEKWGVINLCNDKINKCCGLNSKKTPCTRTPRYTKNNIYYCKIHVKNKELKIPPKKIYKKFLLKEKCATLKKIYTECGLKEGKKMKKKEYLDAICQYVDENYFDPIIQTKAKDFNIITLGRNMRSSFNYILKEVSLDRVIVENQIGPLANRMKTLQGMVMQHFIELCVPIIEEISASNKLKPFLTQGQRTTYNQRKKIGIEVTRKQLNETTLISNWQNFFLSHKKKDDLADSFLQGLWYLNSIYQNK
jgi:hypothetical protein